MPGFGTATCPSCVRRVTVKEGRFMPHRDTIRNQPCSRAGTEARDVHPVKGVA